MSINKNIHSDGCAKMASCIGIIPARLESSRLPGKPLKPIGGKSLICRVWERAQSAQSVDKVYIATDSDEIRKTAESFGAEVIMTSPVHRSGTDRVYEAFTKIPMGVYPDLVLNIQGDMPFIDPSVIDLVVGQAKATGAPLTTVAFPIWNKEDFLSPSVVKVVLERGGRAMYFSRAPIPYGLDAFGADYPLRHLGLYAYTPLALERFCSLSPSFLEESERLEQLRGLEDGIEIRVVVVRDKAKAEESCIEVNTEEDLQRADEFALKLEQNG